MHHSRECGQDENINIGLERYWQVWFGMFAIAILLQWWWWVGWLEQYGQRGLAGRPQFLPQLPTGAGAHPLHHGP